MSIILDRRWGEGSGRIYFYRLPILDGIEVDMDVILDYFISHLFLEGFPVRIKVDTDPGI